MGSTRNFVQVSRRDFLRGVAVGVGSLGVASVVNTATAATGKAPEVTLRYASPMAGSDPSCQAQLVFKQKAEDLSNGRIRVDVFTDAALGGAPELVEQVRAGTITMALGAASWLQAVAPQFLGITLPYLFTDRATVFKVLDGPVGQKFSVELEKAGLTMLGWHDSGFRHVMNNKRPVNIPADMAGMKIRLQSNPAHLEAFRAFGAIPVAMDIKEVYSAAQQGVVDGLEYPLAAIAPNRFHEVTKYLSLTGHAFEVIGSYVNRAAWEKLPPDLQKVVLEASKAEIAWERQKTLELEGRALADLKAKGMVINQPTPAQIKQFVDIARPLYSHYESRIGKDLLAELVKAVSS
jgi:tripartite ATP-independent transporter DctP family solute receptor